MKKAFPLASRKPGPSSETLLVKPGRNGSGERRADGRGSWSRSSARTATTAASRSSRPRSPTSASTLTSARCSSHPQEAAQEAVDNDVHIVGGQLAGRRPPDARAGDPQATPDDPLVVGHPGRRRRRDPAAGLRRTLSFGGCRGLRARHGHHRCRDQAHRSARIAGTGGPVRCGLSRHLPRSIPRGRPCRHFP